MPLDASKIKELMAKKATPVKRGGGGRRKVVDYTDRSYKAWFALEHTDRGEGVLRLMTTVTILTVSIVKSKATSQSRSSQK